MLEGEALRRSLKENGNIEDILGSKKQPDPSCCPFCAEPITDVDHTHLILLEEQPDGSVKEFQRCAHHLCTLLGALGLIPTPDISNG